MHDNDGQANRRRLGRRIQSLQSRYESVVTRSILIGIFGLGLVAQFVPSLGNALAGKAYLGGSLLSLVAYVLYSKLGELNTALEQQPSSGAVLDTPEELGVHYESAFAKRSVRLRFIGYTGETVFEAFIRRLDRLSREPGATRDISIQILIPDYSRPMAPPCRPAPEPVRSEDDPEFRYQQWNLSSSLADRLHGAARNVEQQTGIRTTVDIRTYAGSPQHKIYLLGDKDVFLGPYDDLAEKPFPYHLPAVQQHVVYDPQGYQTRLQHWNAEDGDESAAWVRSYDRMFAQWWGIAQDFVGPRPP